ncbi:hypothetical protein RUM43_003624, partial [Polyplax serrata]
MFNDINNANAKLHLTCDGPFSRKVSERFQPNSNGCRSFEAAVKTLKKTHGTGKTKIE